MQLAPTCKAATRMFSFRLIVGALAASFLITLSWVAYHSAVLANPRKSRMSFFCVMAMRLAGENLSDLNYTIAVRSGI